VLLQREAAETADSEIPESWGETLVESVLRDLESSSLPEKEKMLLRFVDRVNHDSPRLTAADMQPLYQVGWTDEAIYYAITVCALFNFYNRWIDASGVHALSDETHRQGGVRSANAGYVRK
jgi:alkylhydroperoxidase family enzyme